MPWAALTVKKVVVGDPPGAVWAFSGGLGHFALPATGGATPFPLTPGQTVPVS